MNTVTGAYRKIGDDAWRLCIEFPYDPIINNRTRIWSTVHGTEFDASQELYRLWKEAVTKSKKEYVS